MSAVRTFFFAEVFFCAFAFRSCRRRRDSRPSARSFSFRSYAPPYQQKLWSPITSLTGGTASTPKSPSGDCSRTDSRRSGPIRSWRPAPPCKPCRRERDLSARRTRSRTLPPGRPRPLWCSEPRTPDAVEHHRRHRDLSGVRLSPRLSVDHPREQREIGRGVAAAGG